MFLFATKREDLDTCLCNINTSLRIAFVFLGLSDCQQTRRTQLNKSIQAAQCRIMKAI